MNIEIYNRVKKGLEKHKHVNRIRIELINEGYLEHEINHAIQTLKGIITKRSLSRKFIFKDVFDRIGYGFGSTHYLNIFFFLIGGQFFLIGLVNGIKTALSLFTSLMVEEYSKVKTIHKRTVGYSGIIFGSSFLMLAFGIYYRSLILYIIAILVNAVSIVPYGDLFQKMFRQRLIQERKKHIIGKMSYFGLIITGLTIVLAAYVLDRFGISGKVMTVTLFQRPIQLHIYGYLMIFHAAAVSIIISGYILYFLYWKEIEEKSTINLRQEMAFCIRRSMDYFRVTMKNRVLLVLTITGMITGIVQTLGTTYYGIFIFTRLTNLGFRGWMNVAVVFLLAIFATIISPSITRRTAREYGKVSMLSFGATLMAIMPLSYFYKPTLISISMGTIVGIIGASINGVATGLVIKDILHENEMKSYIQMNSLLSIVPYLTIVPIGALVAQSFGLGILFLCLTFSILLFVIPAYIFILVVKKKV